MKKSLIILFVILILATTFIGYFIYNYRIQKVRTQKKNTYYESYYQKEILGTELATIINKAIDQNEQNVINKDEKDKYLENDTDSIKIEISFLETDKKITMEAIEAQGIEAFIRNFGSFKFCCTNIEYHSKTKLIKKLIFEQV